MGQGKCTQRSIALKEIESFAASTTVWAAFHLPAKSNLEDGFTFIIFSGSPSTVNILKLTIININMKYVCDRTFYRNAYILKILHLPFHITSMHKHYKCLYVA